METSFYSVIVCLAKSVAFGKAAVPKPSPIKGPCKKRCIEPNLLDGTGRPSVVYSLDYLMNTVSGPYKVKSALPIPLFRLYLSFIFLRVLNSSFYILL